jgi:hypothetical protein
VPGSPKKRARRLLAAAGQTPLRAPASTARPPAPAGAPGRFDVTHETLRKNALVSINALVRGASTEALRLGAAQVAFEELGRHDELAPERQFFGLFPSREMALAWLARELVPRLVASGELQLPPAPTPLAEILESVQTQEPGEPPW